MVKVMKSKTKEAQFSLILSIYLLNYHALVMVKHPFYILYCNGILIVSLLAMELSLNDYELSNSAYAASHSVIDETTHR